MFDAVVVMNSVFNLRCQSCGSSLQIPEGSRYVTCAYCGTALQIVQDATTIRTEALGDIQRNSFATVRQLQILEIQNDIARLDRERELAQQRRMRHHVRPEHLIIAGVFLLPAALMIVSLIITVPVQTVTDLIHVRRIVDIPFGGLFFTAVIAVAAIWLAKQFPKWKARHRNSDAERAQLLLELEQLRRARACPPPLPQALRSQQTGR